MPTLSAHVNETVTGVLFQPFAFGLAGVTVAMIVGDVSSTTVTVCTADAVFPAASVAVYVRVVAPSGKMFPAGTPVRAIVGAPGQLSVELAEPRSESLTRAEPLVAPAPVPTVTSAGDVIEGAVSSTTVTSCVAVAVAPSASVAV